MEAWAQSTPEEAAAVKRAQDAFNAFDGSVGQRFREKCDRFYDLYRGFKRFESAWE